MQYKHISKEERRITEELTQAGSSNKRIAEEFGRSASRIGRELERNYGESARSYEYKRAQKLADKRRKNSKEPRINEKTRAKVFELFKMDFNPEQIASVVNISHESIYPGFMRKFERDGLNEHQSFPYKVVIAPSGRILRVSKPYEGHVHDFEIRKTEGPLPAVLIFADSGYQDLQNEHSAAVILPKKKPKNGSLSSSEQARNTKLACCRIFRYPARCRILIEQTFAHLKKWNILAARYRGFLSNYPQIFHTIAGIYNLTRAG